MGDRESATPDQSGASEPRNGEQTARLPRVASARAPWERVPVSNKPGGQERSDRGNKPGGQERSDRGNKPGGHERSNPGNKPGGQIPERPTPGETPGNHTHGVAVADLIAKVTHARKAHPPTRRRVDVSAPDEDATVPIVLADPLPDLAALARTRQPLVTGAAPYPSQPPRRPGPPPPPDPTAQPARRHRPALLMGRLATALIAVCALAITGAAWQWQSAKNKLLNTIAALDPNSGDIRDPNAQIGDENFLIVGVDSRIGANSEMGAGDIDAAAGARSDTIMLVNVPANRKRVVAVSFPRDLAITPMNCQAWNPETGKYGPVYDKDSGEWSDNERETGTKLNSAYALGGPKCLVKVIQKFSGLAINRFMAVDFAGFAKMVDALGGVEVCSTTPLDDAELGPVLPAAGRQKLDGPSALNYVRARSIATEGNGDYGRIKRQQLFLSSLLRSMISSDTLFDLDRLDEVVNTFIDDSYVDNVQTRDLVRLGQSLQGINAGRITFVTVPTTGVADVDGNEVPRTQDVRALFDSIIDDDPLPGENDENETVTPHTSTNSSTGASGTSSADSTSSATTTTTSEERTTTTTEEVKAVAADPRDVTVVVANATQRSGLADEATKEYDLYGFDVREPDYYSDWGTVTTTTVYYSLGNEQAAATIAATLPGAQIERISGLGEIVQVVLGPDFTTVKYPQASGTTLNVNVTHAGGSIPTKLPADLTVTNGADVSCE